MLLEIGKIPPTMSDKIASTDNVFVALKDESNTGTNNKNAENNNKAAAIIPPEDPDEEEEEKYDMKQTEEASRSGSGHNTPSHSSPLLENVNNGFGTFDNNKNNNGSYNPPSLDVDNADLGDIKLVNDPSNSPNDNLTKDESIQNVQSCLHHGMQPKLSPNELHHVQEGIYYSKFAIASYGCPLYSLEYPCGICCAPPWCLIRFL